MNKYDFEAVEKHIAESQKFLSEIQKGKQVSHTRFTHFPTNAPIGEVDSGATSRRKAGAKPKEYPWIPFVTEMLAAGKSWKEIIPELDRRAGKPHSVDYYQRTYRRKK